MFAIYVHRKVPMVHPRDFLDAAEKIGLFGLFKYDFGANLKKRRECFASSSPTFLLGSIVPEG